MHKMATPSARRRLGALLHAAADPDSGVTHIATTAIETVLTSEQRRSNENGDWPNSGSVLSPSDDDTLVKPYSPQSACSSSTHTAVTLSHSTSHLGTHQHTKHPGLLTPGSIRHPLSSILQPPPLCDPTTRPLTLPLSRCPSTTYSLFSSTDTVWFPLPQHSPTTGGCASAEGTPILA